MHGGNGAAVQEVRPPADRTLRGLCFLVTGGGENTRRTLAALLRRAGARAMAVGAASALTAVGCFRFDAMVSEVGAGPDAFDVMRALRALPAYRGGDLPAVALLDSSALSDAEACLREGFQAVIANPPDHEVLLAALQVLAGS